jgi:hypothetical protein
MRTSRLLLALILLGAPSAAAAQGLTYGLKAGINFATIDADGDEDAGYRLGLAAGGFVALPLGSRLTIQPEGLFSQKGSKSDLEGVSVKLQLDYVEIPILVKYALSGEPDRSFFVYGGPSIAFKIRSRATATFGDVTVDTEEDENIKDSDFGLVFGGGRNFGRLSLDGRYNLGLSNIDSDESGEQKVRTRAITVLVGVRF